MRYFIMFAAIVVMFGCGEKAEEKAMEKAIESGMGGNAEVDIEKGSFRVQTEEGEMTMTSGDSVKLPADFPGDVFLYKGADLNTAMKLPQGFNLMFQTKDDTSKVSEAYLAEMEAKGWSKEMSMDMGGRKMLVFKKDERIVNVSIASHEEMTQIALTFAKE
ncbi:MAG: hypothetical protein JW896_15100 [Deltaproteobacteria bacterium]|nr:hypothetical protein [Deltaproteobacteria bacterium]